MRTQRTAPLSQALSNLGTSSLHSLRSCVSFPGVAVQAGLRSEKSEAHHGEKKKREAKTLVAKENHRRKSGFLQESSSFLLRTF